MKQSRAELVVLNMVRSSAHFLLCVLGLLAAPALADPPASVSSPTDLSAHTGQEPALPADPQTAAMFRALQGSAALLPSPPSTRQRTTPRASVLGIPAAPEVPPPRTRFDIPAGDPAEAPARTLARKVPRFRNYRAEVPGAVWREDVRPFAIRSQRACLEELTRLGVAHHPVERTLSTPVPVPVVLDGPVEGVRFASLYLDREVEVSCELAARLPAIARILGRHGVDTVGVSSSYRETPKVSFHAFGFALDMAAFQRGAQTLIVEKHFEVTPDRHTCAARPNTPEGKVLLAIACDLAGSRLISSVLTPNYNEGHHDHFHVDVRPDDPRLFLR